MTVSDRLYREGRALYYNSLIHEEIKDLPFDEQRYTITALFYFLSEELRDTFVREENEQK